MTDQAIYLCTQSIEMIMIDKVRIIQLNKGIAKFSTKADEIKSAIVDNKAAITIISEANVSKDDSVEIIKSNKTFEGYKIECKFIGNSPNSRIAMLIDDDITYERIHTFEDDLVPCIVISVKTSPRKKLFIVGYYRQWRSHSTNDQYPTHKPKDQMARFDRFRRIIDRVSSSGDRVIIGGDINLDRNLANDPYNRIDIKDTLPLLDSMIIDHNFTQMNDSCTRFRAGHRPSLLDLFLSNCPNLFSNTGTFTNLASEHLGVRCDFASESNIIKPQFMNVRKYKNINYKNIISILDPERYNEIFQLYEPNDIANSIQNLFSSIIDHLAPNSKIQIRKNDDYISQKTMDLRSQAKRMVKLANRTGSVDDQRVAKNIKNRLSRSIICDNKEKIRKDLAINPWKIIKKHNVNQKYVPTKVSINNRLCCSPKMIATGFNDFFVQKVINLRNSIPDPGVTALQITRSCIDQPSSKFQFRHVSSDEVFDVITGMKKSKSCGTSAFLKQIPRISSSVITHLINNIIRSGRYPEVFKTSK